MCALHPLLAGEELGERDDQRRVADDSRLAVDDACELLEGGQAVLGAGLRFVSLRPLDRLRAHLRRQLREDVVDVDARVPEVERWHRGERGHRLAVRPADGEVDRAPPALGEAAVAAGDREAGDEPLEVPFERPRQRLVEVVRVEHEAPVRGRIDPEVREMRIAAELDVEPRPRRSREIGGHQVGRPAVERERRDQHAPVPDRHQLRHARLRLLLEQLDRVGAHGRRLPRGVDAPRHLAASRLAPRRTLGNREMRHRLERRPGRSVLTRRSPGVRLRRAHHRPPCSSAPAFAPVPLGQANRHSTGGTLPSGTYTRTAAADYVAQREPCCVERCHRVFSVSYTGTISTAEVAQHTVLQSFFMPATVQPRSFAWASALRRPWCRRTWRPPTGAACPRAGCAATGRRRSLHR